MTELIFIDPTIVVKHWTKKIDCVINRTTVEDDFQLIEEILDATLEDGEALFETLFVSIDKYTMWVMLNKAHIHHIPLWVKECQINPLSDNRLANWKPSRAKLVAGDLLLFLRISATI
jgi:hypothetical protein